MNVKTWGALEDGSRATRDSKFADIEQVLRWEVGSVEGVLDGREPVPLPSASDVAEDPDRYVDPATGERYEDPTERKLWSLWELRQDTRRHLIYALRASEAASQPQRRNVA